MPLTNVLRNKKHVVIDALKKAERHTHVLFAQELLQLEDRLGSVNRGAVQTTIERFTFPHKYKKVEALLVVLCHLECWQSNRLSPFCALIEP